jgi:hypothetical protein
VPAAIHQWQWWQHITAGEASELPLQTPPRLEDVSALRVQLTQTPTQLPQLCTKKLGTCPPQYVASP